MVLLFVVLKAESAAGVGRTAGRPVFKLYAVYCSCRSRGWVVVKVVEVVESSTVDFAVVAQ